MYVYTAYTGTSLLRTLWDFNLVLNTEVSSIQRSFNTLQYYTGTQNGVLITEVSTFQRFVIEKSHCIYSQLLCLGEGECCSVTLHNPIVDGGHFTSVQSNLLSDYCEGHTTINLHFLLDSTRVLTIRM